MTAHHQWLPMVPHGRSVTCKKYIYLVKSLSEWRDWPNRCAAGCRRARKAQASGTCCKGCRSSAGRSPVRPARTPANKGVSHLFSVCSDSFDAVCLLRTPKIPPRPVSGSASVARSQQVSRRAVFRSVAAWLRRTAARSASASALLRPGANPIGESHYFFQSVWRAA